MLGRTLKEARLSQGMTLRDLEAISNISNAYLSQLENDKIKKPSALTLYTLSNLLSVDFDYLMVLSGFVQPKSESHNPNELIAMRIDTDEEKELIRFLKYIRFSKNNYI